MSYPLPIPPEPGSSTAPYMSTPAFARSGSGPYDAQHWSLADRSASGFPVSEESVTPEGDEDEHDPRKKPRLHDEDGKVKATRGSKACLACRKLKMRCVGAEKGGPCIRCIKSGQECQFEPSQRGKRRNHKTEAVAKQVEKMEATLETVLKSIQTSDPALLAAAAGMIAASRSPTLPSTSAAADPSAMVATVTATPLPASRPPVCTAKEFSTLEAWAEASLPPLAESHPPSASQSTPPSPRLHSLPENSLNPLGLLAEASLGSARSQRQHAEPDTEGASPPQHLPGIADPRYFQPGPISILPLRRFIIEHKMAPALLRDKILAPEEVVELFDIYFRHLSPRTCLLVSELYTPATTGARSPFLFTCICTVASRYYHKRPGLYAELSKRAIEMATDVIVKGYKSVEVIQGFFLLAMWSQPVSRYEHDRTWQFSGIALRLATDLNLFRRSNVVLPDTMDEATKSNYRRELLNRERTWLYCWSVDRSMATLLGKPPTIQEDAIIRGAKTWYSQPESSLFDIGLVAMVEMHRINARIVDVLYSSTSNPGGLNHDLNYRVLMRSFISDLTGWQSEWQAKALTSPAESVAHGLSRNAMREFYWRYYSLVFLGCGLQHAVEAPNPSLDLPTAYAYCLTYATDLVEIVLRRLVPLNAITYMNDSILLMITYGATFLLKLTKPVFKHLCDEGKSVGLVEEVAAALEASQAAEDVGPALYGAFLRALLKSRKNNSTSRNVTRASTPIKEESAAPLSVGTGFMQNGVIQDAMMGVPSAQGSPRLDPQQQVPSTEDPYSHFWSNFLLPGIGGDQVPPAVASERLGMGAGLPLEGTWGWPYEFGSQPQTSMTLS